MPSSEQQAGWHPEGFDKVQVPGDRGRDKLNSCLAKGAIEVDDQLMSDLEAIIQEN